jgi:hypothetical protein
VYSVSGNGITPTVFMMSQYCLTVAWSFAIFECFAAQFNRLRPATESNGKVRSNLCLLLGLSSMPNVSARVSCCCSFRSESENLTSYIPYLHIQQDCDSSDHSMHALSHQAAPVSLSLLVAISITRWDAQTDKWPGRLLHE